MNNTTIYQRTTAAQRKAEERANVKYLHISKEFIPNPMKNHPDPVIAAIYASTPDYILGKGTTYVRGEDDISRRDVRKALGLSHRQVREQRVKALKEEQDD